MRGFPRVKTISVASVSLSMILMSFGLPLATAKLGEFVLEWEEDWQTYQLTTVNSVFAKDIDSDGKVEIVTGGFTVDTVQGVSYGQLRVWNKDWCTLALKDSEEWTGYSEEDVGVESVFIANVDSDDAIEIVTVGYETISGNYEGNLSIWNWDGSQLTIDAWANFALLADTRFHSVVVKDVGGDQKPEIIVAGETRDPFLGYYGLIAIWNYNGVSLEQLPVDTKWWQYDNLDTVARGVSVGDVNGDSVQDIVTAGSVTQNYLGRVDLRIWSFDGTHITAEGLVDPPWYPPDQKYNSANATSVDVNDVSGDFEPEIIVAGNAYNKQTHESEGMISVWDLDGANEPILLDDDEWAGTGDTEALGVSVFDVDEDNDAEMITAGFTDGTSQGAWGQLAVWRWDSGSIVEDIQGSSKKKWRHTGFPDNDTHANDLSLWDVDPDTEVEIVTVGSYFHPDIQDEKAELRIWTWNTTPRHNEWLQTCPATHPSARTLHGMAYDSQSDLTVLFGGTTDPFIMGTGSNEEFEDTWAYDYDSNTWTDMTPSQVDHPSARQRHGMAYDSESDLVALFGGTTSPYSSDFMEDTWVYDYETNDWTDMTPGQGGVHPSARMDPMMEYCPETDRVVLFGGSVQLGVSYETWIYDYNNNEWEDITDPNNHPPGRSAADMAYDSESGEIVLFGGYGGPGNLQDTWAFDCTTLAWEWIVTSGPRGRWWHAMAYDADDDRVVMFGGGYSSFGTSLDLDDTWIFDLNSETWTRLYPANSPSKRFGMRMEYFATADVIVLFGGAHFQDGLPIELFSDTWIFIY